MDSHGRPYSADIVTWSDLLADDFSDGFDQAEEQIRRRYFLVPKPAVLWEDATDFIRHGWNADAPCTSGGGIGLLAFSIRNPHIALPYFREQRAHRKSLT